MQAYKDSFFRIFNSDLRNPLQRFFDNRHGHINNAVALELVGEPAVLEKLLGMGLLVHDTSDDNYRLDDRVERFFDEMLGAEETAQADWLLTLLDEIRRRIEGYEKLASASRGAGLFKEICRMLRTCVGRIPRHLESIKSAVDLDYRAGSDHEVKLLKLQWHLDRAKSYGHALADLDRLLRHHVFFHTHQQMELVVLRNRLIQLCTQAGDALINVYQGIEQHLNRISKDHARARKLLRVCALLDRYEHRTATNLAEMAESANGPWFHDLRIRTLLSPSIVDSRPELVTRLLRRAGLAEGGIAERRIHVEPGAPDELPPVIDWDAVFERFIRQKDDLFVFLRQISVDNRPLTEEERVAGYCTILVNQDLNPARGLQFFPRVSDGEWEYAVVTPKDFVS